MLSFAVFFADEAAVGITRVEAADAAAAEALVLDQHPGAPGNMPWMVRWSGGKRGAAAGGLVAACCSAAFWVAAAAGADCCRP